MQLTDQQAYELLNMPIGKQVDIKPRLITYSFYRLSKEDWEVNDASGNWLMANITRQDILDLSNGTKSFTDLNWN